MTTYTDLVPLNDIPLAVRQIERDARKRLGEDALEAARYRIVLREGCHNKPFAPTVGWTVTVQAAKALENRITYMPDGNNHRRLEYVVHTA